MQAQLSPIFWQLLPKAVQAQLSPIFRQLFFGGCAGAALTKFPAAAFFRRLCKRSFHQFSHGFFQKLCRRRQREFSGRCPSGLRRRIQSLSPIFWQLLSGGCAGAAPTNFPSAVFRRLGRRSSHRFFWQMFPGGCACAALTNLLAAVVRRLCRRSSTCVGAALTNFLAVVIQRLCRHSSHRFSRSCLPPAVLARVQPIL